LKIAAKKIPIFACVLGTFWFVWMKIAQNTSKNVDLLLLLIHFTPSGAILGVPFEKIPHT